MNDRLRLHLVKQSIIEGLESMTMKEFLSLDDLAKLKVFRLYVYLTKGR